MITVTFNSESYSCTTALKGTDYIHLLDSNDEMITSFDGVSDFSGFTISGGSWTTPTSADECYLATVGDDGVIRKGGHKCSEVGTKGIHKKITVSTSAWNAVTGGSPLFENSDGVSLDTGDVRLLYHANYSKFLNETNYPNNSFTADIAGSSRSCLGGLVNGTDYRQLYFISSSYSSAFVVRIYKDQITVINNTSNNGVIIRQISNSIDGASYQYTYSNSAIKATQNITVTMTDADRLVAREAELWDFGDLASGSITFYSGDVPSQSLHLIIDGIETNVTYTTIRVTGVEQVSEDELSDELQTKLAYLDGVATTSTKGLMSSDDKTKLDGVETGANKITVDSALSSTSTNPVQNNTVNTALATKAPLVSPTFTGNLSVPSGSIYSGENYLGKITSGFANFAYAGDASASYPAYYNVKFLGNNNYVVSIAGKFWSADVNTFNFGISWQSVLNVVSTNIGKSLTTSSFMGGTYEPYRSDTGIFVTALTGYGANLYWAIDGSAIGFARYYTLEGQNGGWGSDTLYGYSGSNGYYMKCELWVNAY